MVSDLKQKYVSIITKFSLNKVKMDNIRKGKQEYLQYVHDDS